MDLLLLPVAPDAPDRLRVRLRVLLLVLRQHRVHEDGVVARLQGLHIWTNHLNQGLIIWGPSIENVHTDVCEGYLGYVYPRADIF